MHPLLLDERWWRYLTCPSCVLCSGGALAGLMGGSARWCAAAPNSILFLGRPGVGKTTVIREMARVLADDLCKRVVIVDTSNEIGGDGDVPHPAIGGARRMQVPDPSQQHRIMVIPFFLHQWNQVERNGLVRVQMGAGLASFSVPTSHRVTYRNGECRKATRLSGREHPRRCGRN